MAHRIDYNEEMVGNAHPTKADTLNRLINIFAAAGDTIYATAAATVARLVKGTAGQLLGMNDAATAPEYKTLKVLSTGEATNPSQPAFLAYNSVTDANVTGDGTEVTVDFDTEVFDQGSDFAADVFTAPVTGKYQLSTMVYLTGLEAGDTLNLKIITSNRTYLYASATPNTSTTLSILVDMDAADTAYVTLLISGGDKDVSIYGAATPFTIFSGFLAC